MHGLLETAELQTFEVNFLVVHAIQTFQRLRVQSSPLAQMLTRDVEAPYLYKMSGRLVYLQGSDRHTSHPHYLRTQKRYSE